MIALVAGIAVGFALAYVAIPYLARRQPKSFAKLAGKGEPRRLDELIEAARAAALRVRPRRDGFDVLAQPPEVRDHAICVRVYGDPSRIALDALSLGDTGGMDLVFTVALALVPLYGPIALSGVDDGGPYHIDGTKNYHQLREERGARVTDKLRAMLARMK